MTEITAVSIVSTCSDAIMSSGVPRGGFSMSPGIRGGDAYALGKEAMVAGENDSEEP